MWRRFIPNSASVANPSMIHLSRDSFVRPFAVLPLPPLSLSPLSRSLPSVHPLHNPPSPSPQINRFPTLARSLAQCSPHPQGSMATSPLRASERERETAGQARTTDYLLLHQWPPFNDNIGRDLGISILYGAERRTTVHTPQDRNLRSIARGEKAIR